MRRAFSVALAAKAGHGQAVKLLTIRLTRLGLLALAVFCLRDAHLRRQAVADAGALTAERVRDFFPAAAEVAATGQAWLEVRDAAGRRLGSVAQTAPESDRIIGYSGATNTLIARDAAGSILGLRVLRSGDTPDHLAEVVSERSFFKQFSGKRPEELRGLAPDAVAGATLTSTAIAEGVLRRLGGTVAESARFPEAIHLTEVQVMEPAAATLGKPDRDGGLAVFDASGRRIATVLRTAPVTDSLVGYKGPHDSLVLLDATGERVKGIALRKSYDTARYVGIMTGDKYFMNLFNERTMQELAALDFKEAKIEGVSGATESSWALAEGLKRRAASWQETHTLLPDWWAKARWRWQDTGHAVVLLAAFLMAFTPLRGRRWARHLHHALLVVYAGFISGEMLSQGLLTGWAGAGTPWRSAPGLVLLAVVALLAPVWTRRQIYCHHVCPHGAAQQLLAGRLRWRWSPSRRMDVWLGRVPFVLLGFVVFAVMLAWQADVNALEPFDAYLFRVAGWGVIALAVGGLLWSAFTPLAYCRYGCPTGALFKLLRVSGHADRIGWREGAAAFCVLVAWGLSHG